MTRSWIGLAVLLLAGCGEGAITAPAPATGDGVLLPSNAGLSPEWSPARSPATLRATTLLDFEDREARKLYDASIDCSYRYAGFTIAGQDFLVLRGTLRVRSSEYATLHCDWRTLDMRPYGTIRLRRSNGEAFDLVSFRVAEASGVGSEARSGFIYVGGEKADGTTISARLELDGFYEGNDADLDFQSFTLPGFVGLSRVELVGCSPDPERRGCNTGTSFSLDDIRVAVPAVDSDGDGVPDDEDAFPDSNMDAFVSIGGCPTTVGNHLFENGATFMDLILEAQANAKNHGQFVSAVTKMANDWMKAGLITGKQKGSITSCAGG